jgi:hypothetical protein
MTAVKYDFLIEQGSDWKWDLEFPSSLSLIDTTCRMKIKNSKTDSTSILSMATTDTTPYLSVVGQLLSCSVPHTVTSSFTFSTALYDLELLDSTNTVTRVMEGEVSLSTEVTK